MTARGLYVLLNKFVKVPDVFIPGRRRLFTRSRFGFASVNGPSEADILIRKVNGLWVMDQMLVVKTTFDVRAHQTRERDARVRTSRAQQVSGDTISLAREVGSSTFMHRRSYADALKGKGEEAKGHSIGRLHIEEERTQWLYCSLIGILAEGKDALSFKEEFLKIRPLPFQLTDCGGKLLILTFANRSDRERALSGETMALSTWFKWLRPWSNDCKPRVLRDAWIKCTGLPHQLWSYANLSRIGEMWGEVRRGDHDLNTMDLTFGWVKVRTSALQPIAKEGSTGVGISRSQDSPPRNGRFQGKETRDGLRSESSADTADFSNSPPISRSIIPFVPPATMAQQQDYLVVDLGRAFGPIPLLRDTHATSAPLVESLGQRPVGLATGVQGTVSGGILRHAL
ncbi:hypothetical protein Dimus_023505 [Dionaea muscipula]